MEQALLRALVVEDSPTDRLVLKKCLSGVADCDFAEDGKAALACFESALAEKRPYSLVCMDVLMPVMDGHEAVEAIRGIEEAAGRAKEDCVKIVMVSSLFDRENLLKGIANWDGYLSKPIRRQDVLDQLSIIGVVAAE